MSSAKGMGREAREGRAHHGGPTDSRMGIIPLARRAVNAAARNRPMHETHACRAARERSARGDVAVRIRAFRELAARCVYSCRINNLSRLDVVILNA
ncbi:hypothetical protein [Burkholderia stagnalis]|uniref:hypothetical protein n=1 Tax=Burkholderia stagnalis TaxID=1503054 RepID=UPI0012D89E53|nr:hypothetical protein [Burkholderia stagnalis]